MKTTKITGTVICAGKLINNNGEEVRGVLIEADLDGKTVPFYRCVEIVEIDEFGYRIAEQLTRHPLAQRLIACAKNPWIIHLKVRPDIEAAARLLNDQHTAIQLALDSALDDNLRKCIAILGEASNEYPFLTDAEKMENETP